MNALLATPIAYLKGVGPQKAQVLQEELGIYTFQDLLFHFPYRYQDRSSFIDIANIQSDEQYVQLKGRFTHIAELGSGRNKKLSARFTDGSGFIDFIWFQGFQYIKGNLNIQDEFIVFGKPKFYQNNWNIPHPELLKVLPGLERKGFEAFYPSTEKCQHKGLHSKGLSKLISNLFEQLANQIPETLPAAICTELNLVPKIKALRAIHQPASEIEIKQARYRLKWEELFFLQLELLLRKGARSQKLKGYALKEVGAAFLNFYQNHLPFELTGAQKRVLKEIRKDLGEGQHMNRLLQGDVGSGKTIVAALSAMTVGVLFCSAGIGMGLQLQPEWLNVPVSLLIALAGGIWRLYTAIQTAAQASARLEARTEAAEATVTQLKAEIARKDAALSECATARTELRQLLISCREGS